MSICNEGVWRGKPQSERRCSSVWAAFGRPFRGFAHWGAVGICALASVQAIWSQSQAIVWFEDFEDTDAVFEKWHVEGGTWEVGRPTAGPGRAFEGAQCAGTVLGGNYVSSVNARLIRDEAFIVPPASENPRLSFYHWWGTFNEDPATVQVRPLGGEWRTVSLRFSGNSPWTRALYDLSEFEGQSVQIAFLFQSNSDRSVSSGYYVDDVRLIIGPNEGDLSAGTVTFEAGMGDWYADRGTWQAGEPKGGPGRARTGRMCAGTVLDGNYESYVDSRLISPPFRVPSASENPRLSFWHWWNNFNEDPATVQVRSLGGQWKTITGSFVWNSPWSRTVCDLSEFSGAVVQVAFRFQSNSDRSVAQGYYVDDISIVTGDYEWDINAREGFESGIGDWYAENGTWQVGVPLAGPGAARSGRMCAGTVLDGNYEAYVDSRLISPPFLVPPASENPRLSFWHWWNNFVEDPATVQVRPLGGEWTTISLRFSWNSPWTRTLCDLSQFEGQVVQIAFRFQSNQDRSVALGYYVDDIELIVGTYAPDLSAVTTTFESGMGDWYSDRGTWQVGEPKGGPGRARTGRMCAGTVLDGNYESHVDSRLISPPFRVPPASENPRLSYWHWWNNFNEDPATVQIRVLGGEWRTVSKGFSWNSPWTRCVSNLSEFGGEVVQVAFRFQSNSDRSVAQGYYVDDISVLTGPFESAMINRPEGFEAGIGDWHADSGTWQVGVPISGPGAARGGRLCAGTVLDGNYAAYVDSRLVSPPIYVPCMTANPRLRYWEWYNLASGDEAIVEIREVGSDWVRVAGPLTGSSGGVWTTGFVELAAYAGKTVEIGYRLRSDGDSATGVGWLIDDVQVQGSLIPDTPPITVVEGEIATVQILGACPELRFSLGEDSPEGATIDPDFGVFAWIPLECQGPGEFEVTVRVHGSAPGLSALTETKLQINVQERNSPPQAGAIDPIKTLAGDPIAVEVTAFDLDCPEQVLEFSLDEGAPPGARIDSRTGEFTWTPTVAQAGRPWEFSIRVTDNGSPRLSSSVEVRADPAEATGALRLRLLRGGSPDDDWGLRCEGLVSGEEYLIETSTDLRAWENRLEFRAAAPQQEVLRDRPDANEIGPRFFRIRGKALSTTPL